MADIAFLADKEKILLDKITIVQIHTCEVMQGLSNKKVVGRSARVLAMTIKWFVFIWQLVQNSSVSKCLGDDSQLVSK